MITTTIDSIEKLPLVVTELLKYADGNKKFLLNAEMGSGKTTFVKAFCTYMGVESMTSSPTFSLVNEYEYADGLIRHLDLYRIKNIEEALDFGIEDYLYDDAYLFVEWPDLIMPIVPEDIIVINITVNDNLERVFSFDKY